MLKIVWNRRCSKCRGQYYLEKAEDGEYLVCLQCGRTEKIGDTKTITRQERLSGVLQ